jgi:two-component system sensor histidine kinase KdpD
VELSDSALQSLANLVAIGLERARAQEAASRAEAARQSEELKSMLMDAIAHEFQTPLTSIKAATTALLSEHPPTPQEQREFMTIVDEEASRLSDLVDDAIQMARVEAGKVQLHRESWHVTDLIRAAIEKLKPVLDGRQVDVAVPSDLPPLPADRELVTLALRQLLNNAVKYSAPQAPISIAATVEDGRVLLSVRDRGPGISEIDLDHIFDKFYRARSAADIPGAGLGLAIAREVALAHGGEIWAESASGEGSTFFLALPLLTREAAR